MYFAFGGSNEDAFEHSSVIKLLLPSTDSLYFLKHFCLLTLHTHSFNKFLFLNYQYVKKYLFKS